MCKLLGESIEVMEDERYVPYCHAVRVLVPYCTGKFAVVSEELVIRLITPLQLECWSSIPIDADMLHASDAVHLLRCSRIWVPLTHTSMIDPPFAAT